MHPIELARKLGTKVGDDCRFINFPMLGSEPYLIEIGNHVTISSDVVFSTHDGGTWVFREKEQYKDVLKFGKIKIGNNCFIGLRSVILPGVTIGDDCVIGACSLVTKSVPSGEVWGGYRHISFRQLRIMQKRQGMICWNWIWIILERIKKMNCFVF